MKYLTILMVITVFFSCKPQDSNCNTLQKQIDSLKIELAQVYKPGFGFLMTNIQAHHAKLWFAGIHKNWKLAQFEIKEIKEVADEIQEYQKQREETKLMSMIEPALVDLERDIGQKNIQLFKKDYEQLTIACNDCHKLTDFEYNIVKIPETLEFSNQEFKVSD
ncbi:MAG: hypothetical protein L3J74_15070 [Bacteroidales bacterium]|nr:hypothetical protein [Bacteroidales bacterium]